MSDRVQARVSAKQRFTRGTALNTHAILKVLFDVIDCIISTLSPLVHMVNSSTASAALTPPSPALTGTWPRPPRRGLKRPRGLWKARRRLDPAAAITYYQLGQASGGATSSSSGRSSDTDRDEEERGMDESGDEGDGDDMSQGSSSSSKRQRRDSGSSGSMELWAAVYVEADPDTPAPNGDLLDNNKDDAVGPPMVSNMITTSITESASSSSAKETYGLKDWEELKVTLARASELYDRSWYFPSLSVLSPGSSSHLTRTCVYLTGEDLFNSISLLRAVIHECHRFLRRFPDPYHFFSQQQRGGSSSPVSGLGERSWHDPRSSNPDERWRRGRSIDRMSPSPTPDSDGHSSHRYVLSPFAQSFRPF
jgi:hypothetical protein